MLDNVFFFCSSWSIGIDCQWFGIDVNTVSHGVKKYVNSFGVCKKVQTMVHLRSTGEISLLVVLHSTGCSSCFAM